METYSSRQIKVNIRLCWRIFVCFPLCLKWWIKETCRSTNPLTYWMKTRTQWKKNPHFNGRCPSSERELISGWEQRIVCVAEIPPQPSTSLSRLFKALLFPCSALVASTYLASRSAAHCELKARGLARAPFVMFSVLERPGNWGVMLLRSLRGADEDPHHHLPRPWKPSPPLPYLQIS